MVSPAPAPVVARPAAGALAAGLGVLYLVWGTTYLAVRFALESFPPLTLCALRFTLAGLLLHAWCRLRGLPRPRAADWRSGFVIGGLLCTISNGLVVWAELRVASGLAALMVATVPLWMCVGEALVERRVGGGRRMLAGLVLGSLGVALLAWPSAAEFGGELGELGGALDPLGALALVASPLTWTAGSLLARRLPAQQSSLQSSALQMLCGGALLLAAALAFEAPWRTLATPLAPRAVASLAYLCLGGSLVCLTVYGWLLKHMPATSVATYAYVNPVVALCAGAWLADEPFEPRAAIACALILPAVVLVLSRPQAR
jgi:drug/metabolite transporter (DMT)-like permease